MSDSQPASANRAVFLSYASQDAAAAQRICEALRAAGIDVWFDQSELVGGDQWDAKIRSRIATCALFVPVVSANTQARLEGYFRIEWKLAAQRTHAMAEEKAFLLPVVIDDTRDAEAKVPAEFKAVQWTRLPGGETSAAFCAHAGKLLDGEVESARRRPAEHGAGNASPLPAKKGRRVPAAMWAGVAVVAAVLLAWKFWLPARGALRDPELQRAAALFDFNSPDSKAEGYALAEEILKSVLAKRPADVEAVVLYAWLNDLFMIRGFDNSEERRALARRYTERAMELAPQNADALAARGLFFNPGVGNDPARAEQFLRQAIAINPRDPRYYRMLSFALAFQGKSAEAMRNARQAVALFPTNALVHYDFGLVQLYLGDVDGSEKAFRETLAFVPADSLLCASLHADLASFAAFAHADLGAMKDWLDRMPASFGDSDREVMPLFIYACASGNTEGALATLQRMTGAWLHNYGDVPKGLLMGDLLLLQGKPELARGEFEAAQAELMQARAREPGKVHYRQLEFWTLFRLGRLPEARAALRGMLETVNPVNFDPLYPGEYWYGPFAASLVLGEKDWALKYLRQAVVIAPWRRYFRNMLKIDSRLAAWRDDAEIAAQLADPAEKTSAVTPAAKR